MKACILSKIVSYPSLYLPKDTLYLPKVCCICPKLSCILPKGTLYLTQRYVVSAKGMLYLPKVCCICPKVSCILLKGKCCVYEITKQCTWRAMKNVIDNCADTSHHRLLLKSSMAEQSKGSFTLATAVFRFCSGLRQHRDRNFSISAAQCNCPLRNPH